MPQVNSPYGVILSFNTPFLSTNRLGRNAYSKRLSRK